MSLIENYLLWAIFPLTFVIWGLFFVFMKWAVKDIDKQDE